MRDVVPCACAYAEQALGASCPVCHEELGRERTVPRCAHSLCTPCAERIMRRHGGKFACPLCRDESYEPAMASELRITDGSSEGTRVLGSWGTKVTISLTPTPLLAPSCRFGM